MPRSAPSHAFASLPNKQHKTATPCQSYKHLYGRRWRKARALFLNSNPLCVRCRDRGEVKAADVVDHIVPHKGNQSLFWDQSNWQPLCKRDHDVKTATEDTDFAGGEGGLKVQTL